MTTTAAITLALAVIGTFLGVMNTWRSFDRDRIRIVVSPRWAFRAYPGAEVIHQLCIEVTNLSFLPVTIDQVAFQLRGPERGRIFVFMPECTDGGKMPRRMEPRSSFTVLMKEGLENDPHMKYAQCAFAKTACGVIAKGTSRALRSHVKKLNKDA